MYHFLLYLSELGGKGFPKEFFKNEKYRGSPTCTVSTSTISTSTNFQKVLHKFVLVGDLIRKFVLVELTVCTTQLVQISHSMIFSRSQKSY